MVIYHIKLWVHASADMLVGSVQHFLAVLQQLLVSF